MNQSERGPAQGEGERQVNLTLTYWRHYVKHEKVFAADEVFECVALLWDMAENGTGHAKRLLVGTHEIQADLYDTEAVKREIESLLGKGATE